jgi:hypothetical protein
MRLVNCVCRIAVFVVLVSLPLRAQHAGGAVTATGQVSAVAAVSAGLAARLVKGDAQISSESDGARGLILSLSGPRGGETQIEIPAQLRSNSDFALIASCTTKGTRLSALSVVEVGGAGAFVYQGAAERVKVPAAFDGRSDTNSPLSGKLEIPLPATILTAPPISTGGTLDSPGNMIEVVLRVVLAAPDLENGWEAQLKLSTAPQPKPLR